MNENTESNPLFDEIYIPILENNHIESTISQGKGAIFFSTQERAEAFLEEVKSKDPEGIIKDCIPKVLRYKRV